MELEVALLTAMNKNTQELYHEVVRFDSAEAQGLSIRRSTSCARWKRTSCRLDRDRARLLPLPDVPLSPAPRARHERASRLSDLQGEGDPRSRTGSAPDRRTAGVPGFRLCRQKGAPSPGTPSTSSASTPWSRRTASSPAGRRALRRFTGKAALVMTRKGTPAPRSQPDLPRLGDSGEIERVEAEIAEIRPSCPSIPPSGCSRSHVSAASRSASTTSTSRASSSTSSRSSATRADRARRGLHGRRRHGARPARLRQADPGAGRSRSAAADQGRGAHQARPT